MGKENDIQWHLGFCAAMELELREYADKLEFHREYPLSRKPLLIDLLVVEKTEDFEITNDIGQIFQKGLSGFFFKDLSEIYPVHMKFLTEQLQA